MDVKVSGVQVIQIEILTNLQKETCYDKLYIFTGGLRKTELFLGVPLWWRNLCRHFCIDIEQTDRSVCDPTLQ